MLLTNIVLGLALIAMIAGFIWLFRDGEGPMMRPGIVRRPEPGSSSPEPHEPSTDTDKAPGEAGKR